jgi:leader peptidase (prepilin peptidase)/N-methyltransferase
MQIIFSIFVFIFGTIIGSFLNVVVCRYNTGRGLGGRSRCAVTGKTLRWFELIPIVSYLIQGGKSRYSQTRISAQYPLVEFFTGFSFLLIFQKFVPDVFLCPEVAIVNTLFYFAIFSFFILIFVYDLKHKIIPNEFLYLLLTLSFSGMVAIPHANPKVWFEALSGVFVSLPLLLIFLLTRGRGIGFADILLVLSFGWLLGLSGGLAALLLGFWIGAIFGIALLIARKAGRKTEIPFAPFLLGGFVIAFLYNIDMSSIAVFFGSLF